MRSHAAASADRESWLTYLACLFSSSRFRLATYPSRYFWSSSNVPTVWLNVLSKIKWNALLWQYQGNLTLCSRFPEVLRLHGGISMCVLARALSVITQKLSGNLLLAQGLTLASSLPIRLDCWPASSRYMTLSISLPFFFNCLPAISNISSQFQNRKGNSTIFFLHNNQEFVPNYEIGKKI